NSIKMTDIGVDDNLQLIDIAYPFRDNLEDLRKSTSRCVYTLGGAVVSWKSSKQTVNTRSTMEAEFVALDKAAEEAEWLRSFLEGIPLWPKPVTVTADLLRNGIISIDYVKSKENIADPLTKGLCREIVGSLDHSMDEITRSMAMKD
ncbi:hypothetical protein Tco_0394206, partial [Tanacetum coccineum]